jgi:predicted esterase
MGQRRFPQLAFAAALLGLLAPGLATSQGRRPPSSLVIFKDGFFLRGKVMQQRDVIFDPEAKVSFSIPKPGGLFWLDDDVRRLLFSPAQVQEVIAEDPTQEKDLVKFERYKMMGTSRLPGYEYETASKWDNKWTRVLRVNTPSGRMEFEQRLAVLTPRFARVHTVKYDWAPCYLTQELDPDLVRSLILQYYADKKDVKELDKRLTVSRFFLQAGWLHHAQKELDDLAKDFPDQESTVVPLRDGLKKLAVSMLAEDLDKLHAGGRHQEVQKWLEQLAQQKLESLLTEKQVIRLQELRAKYRKAKEDMKQAEQFLKEMPALAADSVFTKAAPVIVEELNFDNLPRLETFIQYAAQHKRDLEQKRRPNQRVDEVLALAVSGWLLGNSAAESDVKQAVSLWKARETVLEYQKTTNPAARERLAAWMAKEKQLGVDVVARLIRLLPPPEAHEKIDPKETKPLKLEISVAEAAAEGSYLVVPPPEYNHHRAYPLLILLHSGREKAEDMVARWRELAAKHGYILMAPMWGKGIRPAYHYSAAEHALVLDSLRDVRRRFQIDSDRVFLYGWEQGAEMAWDVGLSHPDQFAGVIPMNGGPHYFPSKYWPNGQFLPFYVIEGDRNGINAGATKKLFKDWTRGHYPSIYVEYKGRGSEWFHGELPNVFEWMRLRKRIHPTKELGRYSTGGGGGEEFKTMRESDNRFYFLSTDHILEKHFNQHRPWSHYVQPATLQASLGTVNTLDKKAGGAIDGARIHTVINVRCSGIRQLSIWLTPAMVDFTKPVAVRVNSSSVGRAQVISPSFETLLEEFYQQGDRQRLFFAKIDLKL